MGKQHDSLFMNLGFGVHAWNGSNELYQFPFLVVLMTVMDSIRYECLSTAPLTM